MLGLTTSTASMLIALASPPGAPALDGWSRVAQKLQDYSATTMHVPRITVERTTVIMRHAPRVPMVEKKAEDCVKIEKISGFSVYRSNAIDLVLDDGKLLRVNLGNECPALGFYSGFYVKPTRDKRICAGRDSLRSRSGRTCNILSVRQLEPVR